MTRTPSRRGPKRSERPASLPEATTDEFAYRVAELAWQSGLTANAIARRLGMEPIPRHLMQVKRALKRAQGRFLRLVPPENQRVRDELDRQVNRNKRVPVSFHVVDDYHGSESASVVVKAAELVSTIIINALRTKMSSPVVICNAGGRALSMTVKALVRNPPLLGESGDPPLPVERLQFVAGNAAYFPTQFQHSANYLSVAMAELFGARHLALPKVSEEDISKMHSKLVGDAALFVCGAGNCSKNSESGLMAQYLQRHHWEIPGSAVGDLAFNLLDADGEEVRLADPRAIEFMSQVNPTVNLLKLAHIAANNRVLLILAADDPESKKPIALAALRRGYPTDVVLGAGLAREILKGY